MLALLIIKTESFGNNSNNPVNTKASETTMTTRDSLILLCYDNLRIAMKSMSPIQLFGIWTEKLIQAQNTNLSDSSKYYIQLVIDELSSSLYDTSQLQVFLEFDTFVNTWYPSASVHLNTNTMVNIFGHIYDFVPGDGGSIPYYENPPDCNCNTSSWFGSCQIFGAECLTSTCTTHSIGCGFLGAYRCSGKCNDAPRPTSSAIPCP